MSIKNNPIIFLFSKTWEYSKGNRKSLILIFILYILSNLISMSEPLLIAQILNFMQEKGVTKENFLVFAFYLSLIIFLNVFFWVFHYPARIIEQKNSFLVRANFKRYMLSGTMNLPLKWHTEHHSGDTIDKIEKGSSALFHFSGDIYATLEILLTFVISFIALSIFNIHSIYLVVFLLVITFFSVAKFDHRLKQYYRRLNKAENKIAAKIYDSISNITTIVILRIEKLVEHSTFKRIMRPLGLFDKRNKVSEKKWCFVSVLTSIFTFLVLITYVYFRLSANEVVLIGSVYALYGYLGRVSSEVFNFTWRYGENVYQKSAILNAEEISDYFSKKAKIKQTDLDTDWNNLQIKNLNFSYSERGRKLQINNLSLEIKRGQRIAFIGESGSGKTTMLKIIRELYLPQSVSLLLDKKVLEKGFSQISESIALIPQDPEIFNTTIKENITMGVNYSSEEIEKYTNMAMFTSVVLRLPKKLYSSIKEKGVNLSGGEKQRLALARGLLASKDKEIVMLDEPTSSVDFRNEMEIYTNIFNEFKDKTIISSIHRLHLLPMFDKIVFFKKGKIIAQGSFSELLETSKDFISIWEKHKEMERKETANS